MRAGQIAIWLGLIATFGGCGNPCESLCDEMAAFARECGYTVTEAEVSSCVLVQSDADRDQRKICAEYGDRQVIEQSWDCTEVGRYYPEQNTNR